MKRLVGDPQLSYMISTTCLIVRWTVAYTHPAATTTPLWLSYLVTGIEHPRHKTGCALFLLRFVVLVRLERSCTLSFCAYFIFPIKSLDFLRWHSIESI